MYLVSYNLLFLGLGYIVHLAYCLFLLAISEAPWGFIFCLCYSFIHSTSTSSGSTVGGPLLHMSSVWVSWSQSKVEFWLSDTWCFGDHILHLRFCFPLKQNCRPLFGVLPGCRFDGRQYAWLAVWLSLNQLILGSGFSFLISWVCRKAQRSVIRERKEKEIQSLWGWS